MTVSLATTPARLRARPGPDGCLVLSESAIAWAHGGEDATAAALAAASDLSDMSDELAELGASWPAAADCARERGHLLRPLDLAADARVLEVGAGCGGATRFLAERCALVDALEPNPVRARLAARRLHDIPTARVLIGEAADIPDEPAYDAIVLIGVLEYIGGWRDRDARVALLAALARRLRPGGHIVCGIENRFGVAYFAGQPDDHSGLLFQTVEDHPRPHPARTFSRAELQELFERAGLEPLLLGAFPDYRFPRLLFAPSLVDGPARPLAWRVPSFPTPPHPSHQAATVLDEGRVWRGLVESGMGAEFPNSFLVVAGAGEPQRLWPDDLLAVFYSAGRRRRFATESRVAGDTDRIVVRRRLLHPEERGESELVQRSGEHPLLEGPALIELLADAEDDAELGRLLRRFVGFAERELLAAGALVPFDLWPGNVLVVDGELEAVDHELSHRSMPAEVVLARALLLTGIELAERTPADRWPVATVRDLVLHLAGLAGAAPRLDDAIRAQAELMAEIFGGDPGAGEQALRERLARPLSANVYGARDAGPGLARRLAEAERSHVALEAASPANEQWWFDAHHQDAPGRIVRFLADDGLSLAGKRVADVGCGDGLVDVGLMQLARPASLVGFDIVPTNVELLLERTRRRGVADALPEGLEFRRSEPAAIPAPDGAFDIVITWSAFEHVSDPVAVLQEMRRVLDDAGQLFLQLWPFYHSERGSHLWEWCPEPFHHLVEPAAEIERRVRAAGRSDHAEMMLREFATLNRFTLDDIGAALLDAGFAVRKLDVQTGVVRPPAGALAHPLSALAISGVQLLATPMHEHERIEQGGNDERLGGRAHLRAAARELRAAGRAARRGLRRG